MYCANELLKEIQAQGMYMPSNFPEITIYKLLAVGTVLWGHKSEIE